jgi:hypothetical protein
LPISVLIHSVHSIEGGKQITLKSNTSWVMPASQLHQVLTRVCTKGQYPAINCLLNLAFEWNAGFNKAILFLVLVTDVRWQ